jgi:bifunctional DNA-binding transcriptional regulator/antitoxin component of YhaV-PrlF toxin-antitoxin module
VGKVAEIKSKYAVTTTDVKGMILEVSKVQDRGRTQIPKIVREKLKVEDEDRIYWVEFDEKIYVMKAVKVG